MNEIDILFEDNHLLCVVKPAGMLAQSDKSGDPDLLGRCRAYIKERYNKPGNVYLALIHRLDRAVGGPMVFAKTSRAAARLSRQFRENAVGKLYHAAVSGNPEPGAGERIDHLIKDGALRIARPAAPDAHGARQAKLRYRTLKSAAITRGAFNELLFPLTGGVDVAARSDEDRLARGNADRKERRVHRISLLEIELFTGRFHQIRFQLARLGCPVLGDFKYGSRFRLRNRGIALEAVRLELEHPVRKEALVLEGPRRLEGAFAAVPALERAI